MRADQSEVRQKGRKQTQWTDRSSFPSCGFYNILITRQSNFRRLVTVHREEDVSMMAVLQLHAAADRGVCEPSVPLGS